MSEAAPALAVRSLALRHDAARAPVFAELSLEVRPREIVCLLGASGCGKSSLLRALAGLATPQAGTIDFLGAPLHAPHPRLALLFQQPNLLPWLSSRANVAFGLDFARQPPLDAAIRERRVDAALAAVGLSEQAQRPPRELSGGMAQRVALARALAREPRLLLADEPFSALDALTRLQMQDLLVELVQRWHTAALLVTHDLDEALRVGDRVLLMGRPEGDPAAPATLVREWVVPQRRPRAVDAPAFVALRVELLRALHALQPPAREARHAA